MILIPHSMESSSFQFASGPGPKRQIKDQDVGGVVPLRIQPHSRGRKSSFEIYKEGAIEATEDEDAGLRNENDYKRKQVCSALPCSDDLG